MKSLLKRFIDRARLGRDLLRRRLAMWRWDGPNPTTGPFVDRVVFIRWDAKLGDAIVLSWVLRELMRQRPDLEITVITSPALEPLFRQGFGVRSIFLAGKQHGWSQLPQIAHALHGARHVVHLSEIWRPRELRFVRQLAPQHVVGLDDELEMVDVKLGRRTQGAHFSARLVPWLEQLGIDTSNRQYWIPRSPAAAGKLAAAWPSGRVVGLCPYGASKLRHLSHGQIQFLVEIALSDSTAHVLMIVRPDQAESLREAFAHEPWFGRLLFEPTGDLFELCEQVANCHAVISVDTAIVHIASGLDKPMIALYADPTPDTVNFQSWHANSPQAVCACVTMGAPQFTGSERGKLKSAWASFVQ